MTIELPTDMKASDKAAFVKLIIAPLITKALPHIKEITFNPQRACGIGHVVYTFAGGAQVEFLATTRNLEVICLSVLTCYRAYCHGEENRLLTKRRRIAA